MTTGQGTEARPASPVTIEGRLDADLSRWLWVVKWLLAIPHYVVLAFLWLAFFVLTVVAFFAILFTGRYPRGIFDFNVGVLRWTWRVAFYSYGALGTDRYPPFTLDEAPDYPATLDVEYPERLSRGLVLVKWWLLAIPQYLLVGILVGGGSFAASRSDDWQWGGFPGGLVGLLVLFAGLALALHGPLSAAASSTSCSGSTAGSRASPAYAGLMTDRYPPFRLDQGGDRAVARPGRPAARSQPVAEVTPRELPRRRWTRRTHRAPRPREHRGALRVRDARRRLRARRHRPDAARRRRLPHVAERGVLDARRTRSSRRAPSSTPSGAEWALDSFLGTVRIRSESERPVFVGIATPGRRRGVPRRRRARRGRRDFEGDPQLRARAGRLRRTGQPGDQTFWVASASGAGEQTLEWEPEDGDWQRRPDERGRVARRLVRPLDRRRARLGALDRARRCSASARCSPPSRRSRSPPGSAAAGGRRPRGRAQGST